MSALAISSVSLDRLPQPIAQKGLGVMYLALAVDDIARSVDDLIGKGASLALGATSHKFW